MRARVTIGRLIGVLCLVVASAHAVAGGTAAAAGNPDGVLVSDTTGRLQFLDLQTGAVTDFHTFAESGNFDIRYASPSKIVIANFEHARIDRFDLETEELTTVVSGPPLSNPIGIAVSPRGVYYIADHAGEIFSYDVRAGSLELLADQGPNGEPFESPDGIVEDRRGRVIFTDHAGRIYRVTPADGSIEIVATIAGASLNGLVVGRRGALFVAAHDSSGPGSPGAIFRVNPATGAVTTLFQGLPLRDPEDVAVDPRGDVYIVDSDFQTAFGDHNPAIYVLRGGTGEPETLADELEGDLVDILLTPFTGPGDR